MASVFGHSGKVSSTSSTSPAPRKLSANSEARKEVKDLIAKFVANDGKVDKDEARQLMDALKKDGVTRAELKALKKALKLKKAKKGAQPVKDVFDADARSYLSDQLKQAKQAMKPNKSPSVSK